MNMGSLEPVRPYSPNTRSSGFCFDQHALPQANSLRTSLRTARLRTP